MLQVFRNSAKGNVGKVIVGLIVITFVLFGAESIVTIAGNSAPASVNGDDVSELDFQRLLNRRQQELTSQFGGEMAAQLANSPYLKDEVINSLINQKLQSQISNILNLEVSEDQVLDTLTSVQAFQIDGVFDKDMYLNVLSQNGFTHQTFVSAEQAQLAVNQMQSGLVDSSFVVSKNIQRNSELDAQKRQIAFQTINAESFKDDVTPSEDELHQYYEENEHLYLSEEQVQLKYIEIVFADVAKKSVVNDSDLDSAYQSYLSSLEGEQEREISHILFTEGEDNKADANKALNRLQEGQDFAALAEELSDDPGSAEFGGSLGKLIPDVYVSAFYDAAIQLKESGDVSGLVETQFGIHLIRLDSINIQTPETLESMSIQLTSEVQDRKARDEMLLLESQLADESFASDDIAQVADVFLVDVQTTDWLSRSTSDGFMSDANFSKAAFSVQVIEDDMISDIVRLPNGNLIAVQKESYEPESTKSFESVSVEVTDALTTEQASILMAEQVEILSEATTELDDSWGPLFVVDRNDSELPAGVVKKAFELAYSDQQLSVGVSEGENTSYVIAVVNVIDGEVSEDITDSSKGYLAQVTGGNQFQILFNQIKSDSKIDIRQ